MAEHKVLTTDEEIDLASAHSSEADLPRATRAEYRTDGGLDVLVLTFSNGRRALFARENLEGLAHATPEQLANIQLLGPGTGLYWPDLDVGLDIPALLQGIYGSERWMLQFKPAGLAETRRAS